MHENESAQKRIVPGFLWLERLTAAILLAVLAVVAWMVVAAARPELGRLPRVEYEVMLILLLLGGALALVSLLALLHTRR